MTFIRKHIGKGILIVAVALIIVGVTQGGFRDTMAKAIRICLECIGIG